MRIRPLGRSGLRLSEIYPGAMTIGMPEWGCDERGSLDLIDRYLATGGNFIDTADAYASMARLEEATRLEPEYPGVFIDVIQHWLGNR